MSNGKIDILRDFVSISTWQSLVAIIIFVILVIGLWLLIRWTKMRFSFRIFAGMGLGLTYGIIFQAIIGFPSINIWEPTIKEQVNKNFILWVQQTVVWIGLLKTVFINAMLMLSVLVVFLAIARVVAKPSSSGLAKMTIKSVIVLLINVAIAYTFTFFISYALKIGQGLELEPEGVRDAATVNVLPIIIGRYMPTNFLGAFVAGAIIPVIVLAALVGYAIKRQTKRYETDMNHARDTLERAWKIVMAMLITFIKIMPYAVMSMLTIAIIGSPVSKLIAIGKVMGAAYLGLIATLIWFTISLMFFNINPWQWWKITWKPFIQGFATQSFQASLPLTLTTVRDEMKVKEEATNLVISLSSTMGLAGCAGVQSGIVLMFVYNGAAGINSQYSLIVWFLMGLLVTVITSLGIAGVPGTAPLVTAGVLAGLGVPAYYDTVYTYLGSLDGILDMGRTGVNVVGGVFATTVVAQSERMIDNPKLMLFKQKPKEKSSKKIKTKLEKQ